MNPRDVRVVGATLWFLPVQTRVPLKFGAETLTSVTCARVRLQVEGRDGTLAEGWGETPLSVQWVWPSSLPFAHRLGALRLFTSLLARAWAAFSDWGHPLELGADFTSHLLPRLRTDFNASGLAGPEAAEGLPWLAALVCSSAFDLALHDAYGRRHGVPTYATYTAPWLNRDLADFLQPAAGTSVRFQGRFPADYLRPQRLDQMPAWHLVGGLDPVEPDELRGDEPQDGYPVLLADWIRTDGLRCLKVKLRGTDAEWDYARLVRVGRVGIVGGVDWLTADFNCTVREVGYVDAILDRLRDEHPRLYGMLLYVEQPFPYELAEHPIEVHSVSGRKPLYLDESAHDWMEVRRGRELGWTGVALKTCKTQSGAILSACWARAHGMGLMVQDLTNPMLAQITHGLLAAHVPTIMGIETNGMQFYPAASEPEAAVHPGLYRRREGRITVETVTGPGFGYRLEAMTRRLPEPEVVQSVEDR
jgi:L-alanine-DL-glutamate epimerase-like enolase superfamily enzyme